MHAVKYLVEAGCDASSTCSAGHTPLHYAVVQGRMDVIRFLIEEEIADPETIKNSSALHLVIKENKENRALDVLRYLVDEHDVDVEETDSDGW